MVNTRYKRPVSLTVVLLLGFLWVVFGFPGVFSPDLKRLGSIYPAVAGILTASLFICFIGVWHMKKWGVELFIVCTSLRILFFSLINDPSYFGMFLSIVLITFFLVFYKKMDRNL